MREETQREKLPVLGSNEFRGSLELKVSLNHVSCRIVPFSLPMIKMCWGLFNREAQESINAFLVENGFKALPLEEGGFLHVDEECFPHPVALYYQHELCG